MKNIFRLWVAIFALAILTPLGLIIPSFFKAGAAWGEWSPQEIGCFVGYVPRGLACLADFWKAPFAGYSFPSSAAGDSFFSWVAYVFCALLGAGATILAVIGIGRLLVKKR